MVRWLCPNTLIPRSLTMPDTTLLDIPQAEQDQMLAVLHRARYGYLLALQVLLLCAAGRHPTKLDIRLWPAGGAAWRPKGRSQVEVMTPGQKIPQAPQTAF